MHTLQPFSLGFRRRRSTRREWSSKLLSLSLSQMPPYSTMTIKSQSAKAFALKKKSWRKKVGEAMREESHFVCVLSKNDNCDK
jgi:hypothetical protein|tara:strand:+ start:1445 stop:1693 length:249 start_codon:yes stop_codon:yes gene_type:complete